GALVFTQVQSLALELPQHKQQVVEKLVHLREAGKGSWLDSIYQFIQEVADQVQRHEERTTGTQQMPPVPVTSADSSPMATLERILGPAVDMLLKAALVVVMVVFMLVQREDLRNRVIRLSGEGSVTSMTKALDDATHRISRFLQMQLLINALYGLAMTV